jgi:hypothetical protein
MREWAQFPYKLVIVLAAALVQYFHLVLSLAGQLSVALLSHHLDADFAQASFLGPILQVTLHRRQHVRPPLIEIR